VNKKLRQNISVAFNAPAPKRKTEFLLSLNFPKATRLDFIFAQVGYLRKRVWMVTLLAIVPALLMLYSNITENALGFVWVISSLLPFIVLAGITEISRSVSHNMAELEAGCKYSFSDVVLVRLGILGCLNLLMFAIVITSFSMAGSVQVLPLGIHLFVPFLLTCALSLYSLNHFRSKENVYICGGIACFVSIANTFLANQYRSAFAEEYLMFWGIAFCVLLIWTVRETIRLNRRTEEYQWNLSLTA
jgi:hypothetical protein